MATNSGYDVSQDTIFVSGLPEETTEAQLAEYFGQIGIIKFDKKNSCPKIWIYKDKTTGKGKGEATVTYDDPPTATSAIAWFNGKEFKGNKLTIELAQRKTTFQQDRGGGTSGFRGGSRGGGGRNDSRGGGGGGSGYDRGDRGRQGSGRPGDWACPSCNNNNFAYRQECNRCRTQKPMSANTDDSGTGGSHYNGGRRHDNGGSRGNFHRGGGGGSSYRDRDNEHRDRDRDRGRDRNMDRDRDRDSYRDRDRDRGRSSNYSGSGPSRSHMRGKDDRRSKPY